MKKTRKNKKTGNSKNVSSSSYTQGYQKFMPPPYSLESYRQQKNAQQNNIATNPYSRVRSESSSGKRVSSLPEDPLRRRQQIKKNNRLSKTESQKLKKRRKKRYRLRLIGMLAVISILFYSIIKLVEAFTYPTVSYQTVQQGTIDNTVFYTGVILRDEVVYQDTVSGDLYYTAAEGEKVKKGTEICYTLEQNISSLLSRLESVDESLYAIQQNREDLTTYQKELYLLNRNAEEEINQFYYLYEGKSTQPLYTLRNQLNKIIQQKSTIYTIDQTDTTVGLQEDKKNLEQQIGGLANSFVTQDAGTVSYQIDGFEYLTLEAFQEMTLTSFQKFLKKENPKTESIDEIDAIPLFKIIKNHAWQLVAYLTKEEATLYTLGETYACKLEGAYTEPILFTLLEKNEKEDGFQIVLESNQQLTNFLNQRIVRFSIGENRAEGLKIPLDAIVERTMIGIPEDYVVEKGEEIGVLRAVGEINEFVPVVVQYTKEIDGVNVSYFVQQLDQAKTLHVNEEILHPMTQEKYQVNDVCIVKGVYTINGRYAKFKEVNISLANDGYAIISDDSQLKAYDQIISNPKYIKEEQLLKHMNIQNE